MLKPFSTFDLTQALFQNCKPPQVWSIRSPSGSSPGVGPAKSSGKRARQRQMEYLNTTFRSLQRAQAKLEMEPIEDPGFVDLCTQLGDVLSKLNLPQERAPSRLSSCG